MDPSIHRGERPVADGYRLFARREAHGISPVYEAWANAVAEDDAVLALLDTLPGPKRQPNLVFAAARHHGADGTYDSFRSTVLEQWEQVRRTITSRATQTNEAARCAVLLPFLARLPQPLALIEVGASAGLCLLPDRYSYRYSDGARLDPAGGPSDVVITSRLGPGITAPSALPHIAWRAGIDLAPVDVTDQDACAWLETLIWPGQPDRLERLRGALAIARREPPRVVRGNLIEALPDLAREAPADATLVVFHSAVLAYLSPEDRSHFAGVVDDLPGHWISNEGRGVLPGLPSPGVRTDDGRFVLAVDGRPRALTDPHGRSVSGLAE
ncbi:DUF2332 domain-containing protein [Georgenia wutianyii]|uniref:DUF2332 domain-containing protein n=1 Tax=Georgenia wutianyii TaxID=2585135 RepID=A0ABX5VN35_9MICO|nr:DUF2332 domain-containing protein [Georgenia wutianyii]QDB78758.1 DUF2332 domain-containing protein [Georgenia wutianyii]